MHKNSSGVLSRNIVHVHKTPEGFNILNSATFLMKYLPTWDMFMQPVSQQASIRLNTSDFRHILPED